MPPGRFFYIWLWIVSAFGTIGLSFSASISLDEQDQKFGNKQDDPNSKSCLKYAGPVEIRSSDRIENAVSGTIDSFQPFQFRANNYGIAEYELESTYLGQPIYNIKMDTGPRPDTVKGGDLDGFYGFYRSFLVPHRKQNPSQVKLINSTRIVFEIWNVYMRKNSSDESKAKVPHELISMNVLFEFGDKKNVRFEPIMDTLREMARDHSKSGKLHRNYDPYGLRPLEGSFAVYETSAFPFPHPIPIQNQPKGPCQPLVKVYLYENRLTMSRGQYLDWLDLAPYMIETGMHTNLSLASPHLTPDIYYTPKSEHLIFRRAVAESKAPAVVNEAEEAGEGDASEYYDEEVEEPDEDLEKKSGEPKYNVSGPIEPEDEALMPPDCAYLYRLQNIMSNRIAAAQAKLNRTGGSRRMIGIPAVVFLIVLPIIKIMN